jgi:hypothetical protein
MNKIGFNILQLIEEKTSSGERFSAPSIESFASMESSFHILMKPSSFPDLILYFLGTHPLVFYMPVFHGIFDGYKAHYNHLHLMPSLGGNLCDTLDSVNAGSICPDEIIVCLPNESHFVFLI